MSLPKVTVYGFVPLAELPDLSPFVSKVVAYLTFQQWPFELKSGNIRKAPRGKLPYVEVNGKRLTDSDNIITELEKLHPKPLGLDSSAHAIRCGRATQSMLEHHFYFLAVYDRWSEANWPILKPALLRYLTLHKIPSFLAGFVANQVRKQVEASTKQQGVGRLSPQERASTLKSLLDSLEGQLEVAPFFGGDKPDRVDFTAFAMLRGYSIDLFKSPLGNQVRERESLMNYLDKLKPHFL